MSIEAGARCGMVAPDDKTFAYLKGRPFAPQGETSTQALEDWRALQVGRRRGVRPRGDARCLTNRADGDLGHQPRGCFADRRPACPIRRSETDETRAQGYCATRSTIWASRRARSSPTSQVDRVFIGSCTNARIEDLRAAAAVLRRPQKQSARAGLAGLLAGEAPGRAGRPRPHLPRRRARMGDSGCSMCVGINGDLVPPGERCASTHQPQLPRPAGPGRAHASDVAGDGRRRGGQRAPRRCAAASRPAEKSDAWRNSRPSLRPRARSGLPMSIPTKFFPRAT